MSVGKGRLAMKVLWPPFLVAGMAEGFTFSLLEPEQLTAAVAPLAVYTMGFFVLWAVCALASLLTAYLLTAPDGDQPF
jgi:hypothetical protein